MNQKSKLAQNAKVRLAKLVMSKPLKAKQRRKL